ncbi:MAG: DNA-binding protein [Betaproteobacteria bacterium]|nr:DNA-binding protein [Betaproteobacteria bacterium]
MKSLFLAWQAPSRLWFPIGRLGADRERTHYVFEYTGGALRARKQGGFAPLTAFPDLHERYESAELFPLFKNRVLDPARKDFADYLRSLDLDPSNRDPIEILAISGGERHTDNFEVFPQIEKTADNRITCRFFLHGLRHVSESAQRRSLLLAASEPLQVSVELNNPATGPAIQLTTRDYEFLGWAPRYLVFDILHAVAKSPEISAHVVRVNEVGVPLNRRVLIELSGRLPVGIEPMSGPDFQPLTDKASRHHMPRAPKTRTRH